MKKSLFFLLIALSFFGCSEEAWDKAKENNTIESYRTYLAENPEGKFIEDAKAELEKLLQDSTDQAKIKEEEENRKRIDEDNEAWEKALSENSFASYYTYCNEYSEGGEHIEDAIERSEEKFKEELHGEFKTVYKFFEYCTKLQYESYQDPQFDEVYDFFSKEHCVIDGIDIPGIHDYNSFQVSETRNVYYQLQFTGEFFKKLKEGEFDSVVTGYPENTEIEIEISFIEDEYVDYELFIKFETQGGKLKVTELSADINEPGC